VIAANVLPAIYGVASAVSWGAGDFCGGLGAKRTHVFRVVIGSQLIGVVALAIAAIAFGDGLPTRESVLWSAVAGLSGAAGLLALYQALATSRMGLAAPVSGVLSAAIPVVAGSALDGLPGSLRLAGFALALIGVWLVASSEHAPFRIGDLGLPVVAGVGFGTFIIVIAWASGRGVFWPLVVARVASLSVLAIVARMRRETLLPPRGTAGIVAASGVFDAGGNAFLVLAAHAGRLDVAGVLSSLYPAITVLLAWMMLHERLTRPQLTGLVAILSAIVMITWR
jgi:drug/metabolite transporter (DMT)-like permease